MKSKHIFLILWGICNATIVLGALPPVKEVKCTVEIMPNYMWHLFTLADIWDQGTDQSLYFQQYASTVPTSDLTTLHQYKDLIVWQNGNTSILTSLLFFTPFHTHKSDTAYLQYLDALSKTFKTIATAWTNFYTQYPTDSRSPLCTIAPEHVIIFDTIKNIIIRNYPTYQHKVWPKVEPILQQIKKSIDSTFADQMIIKNWEEKLNMPYLGEGFYPVLTYANGIDRHLPSANNLSASRNNFGVTGTNLSTDLIIHEIGIFTLLPILKSIYSDPSLQTAYNNQHLVVYQAIESFIEWKKGQITGQSLPWQGKTPKGNNFNFPFFFQYYETQNRNNYHPEQFIRNAIQTYNDHFNR